MEAGINRAVTCFEVVTLLNELPGALNEEDDEQDAVELDFLPTPISSAPPYGTNRRGGIGFRFGQPHFASTDQRYTA